MDTRREILHYYKEGMRVADERNPPNLRQRLVEFKDEFCEFMEEPSIDELSDSMHSFGRIIQHMTGFSGVALIGWPTVKKHAKRYATHGCIRSKRNCKKHCTHPMEPQ
mgnify:CR=1 FL=1